MPKNFIEKMREIAKETKIKVGKRNKGRYIKLKKYFFKIILSNIN